MDEADTHRRNLPISHHLIHYPCLGFEMMIFQFLFDFFSLFSDFLSRTGLGALKSVFENYKTFKHLD